MKESNSNSRSEGKGKFSSSNKSKGKPAGKSKFGGFNKNKSNSSNDSQSSSSNRGSRGFRSDRSSEGSRNDRSGGDSRPSYGAPRNERSGDDSRSDRSYGGSRNERSGGDSRSDRSYGGFRSGGDSRNSEDSRSSRSHEGSRSERSGDENRTEQRSGGSRPSRSYGNSRPDRGGNRSRPNRSGGGSFRSGGRNGGGGNSRGRGGRFKKTRLDPTTLVNTSIKIKEERAEVVTRSFAEMEIHPELQSRIERKGYVNSTEIQDKTFEIIMDGHSVMGIANTGTGKTGAFLIPILNKILSEKKSAKTIILVPTRELAEQVEQELKSLTKGLKVFSSVFIGGTSVRKDLDKLRRPNDVVIGTPGRINDLIDRRALKLFDFSKIVLDEFDTMLDMGFLQDVTKVIDQMHKRDQTILFSATENSKQQNIIDGIIDEYQKVSVSSGEANTDNIYQEIIKTRGDDDKFDILADLLEKEEFEKVLIFLETKRQVSKLFMRLKQYGVRIDEIHGDKTQMYRSKAVRKFKSGAIKVLVATDVASRGIDIDNVTHVINYEIPSSRESYIHRIGRTGRAGKSGNAITFY